MVNLYLNGLCKDIHCSGLSSRIKTLIVSKLIKLCLMKERMVSVILSKMRKAGWLEMRLDPNDARKRLYKLKAPDDVVREIAKGEK